MSTDKSCDIAIVGAAIADLQVYPVSKEITNIASYSAQGMEMKVRIMKEGKEANQGVAYMDDGTMIVVEGGRSLVGEETNITVTSVLQTSAGRMVFAKAKSS